MSQPTPQPAAEIAPTIPAPDLVIALAIDEDGRDWQPGFRDASVKGALIELVPAGSDIKSWSEMVALHTIFTPLSVAAFVANWQGELVAADPRVIHSQTTAADGSITVEYESAAFREKAIRRFMRGTDGVYMLAYHTRPQAVDRAAYDRWGKIIADASLDANP